MTKKTHPRPRRARAAPTTVLTPASPGGTLRLTREPDVSEARVVADTVTAGLAANAFTTLEWAAHMFAGQDLTEALNALTALTSRAADGDLADVERLLTAQAVSLNSIFTALARKAQSADYVDTFERFLRLALRAQNQSARTIEILAAVKNPPTVFTKQANIAHGPQQVNSSFGGTADVPAHAREGHHVTVDAETTPTATPGDRALAPVDAQHRTSNT